MKAFRPTGDTAKLAVSATSARIAIPSGAGKNFRLYCGDPQELFFALGDNTVVATVNDIPFNRMVEVLATKDENTHIAAITAAGTTNLYITKGQGI